MNLKKNREVNNFFCSASPALREPIPFVSFCARNCSEFTWLLSHDCQAKLISIEEAKLQPIQCLVKTYLRANAYKNQIKFSPTLSSSIGEKNGNFYHVPYLGIPKDFRF